MVNNKKLSKRSYVIDYLETLSAKEAFIKAVNFKLGNLKEIEVVIENGKPKIYWQELNVHLSLSHEKDKAIAFVIVEDNN